MLFMKKWETVLIIIAIIILAAALLQGTNLSGNTVLGEHAYTKAICNQSGYCEDYYIKCNNQNVLNFTPTGYAIQSDNYKNNLNESLCG